MKKITWILAILLSLPVGAIWARDEGGAGGGGDRGGGGGGWSGGGGDRSGGDSSAGSGGGSWDASDHSSDNNNHAYSNSARSNGGNFHSGGNSYYRSGGNGYYRRGGYGQVHHFNRSYGPNGSRGYNGHSYSTGSHHFNTSTGGAAHSYVSGSPKPLSKSSMLPHSLQHSSVKLPSQGPSGKAFSASLVSPGRMNSSLVTSHMASLSRDSAFSGKIASLNRSDVLRNNYYWHSWRGGNYCHYFDRWGGNWFGWWWGGSFLWTQWYGDYWWWYDPWNARWCYWWGDGWWWQDPWTTTVYVYENGNYVPGDQANASGGETPGNDYSQPPSDNEAGIPDGESPSGNVIGSPNDENNPNVPKDMVEFPSPDKARTVKIVGESGDAFLYDSAKNSFKPLFLESDVKNVQFSKNTKGALKIKLILSDGSYEIFDAQGKQLKETDAPKTGQSVDVEGDQT